ncbi:ADP-ribose 1''-phosphate phosphatase [Abortiporus biennis]
MAHLVKFTLFARSEDLLDEWRQNFQALAPPEVLDRVTIIQNSFEDLKTSFDCIVSPANSFGRFDGGFDQVLSDTLAPADDPTALTRTAQTILYSQWLGYAPPGTCTLIPLQNTPCFPNSFNCKYIALCPTMRIPASVSWHKEIVYNCVWSLLAQIYRHNDLAEKDPGLGLSTITSVAMTGLATGIGCVSNKICARQTALAFAHFHDSVSHPEKWSNLSWRDIEELGSLNRRLPMDG